MRHTSALLTLFLVCAHPAAAQTPEIEMYGSVAYRDAFSETARHPFYGLEGGIAFNRNEYFGALIEAGGQYRLQAGDLLHAYDLLGGVQFVKRGERMDVSVHALLGVVHGLARGTHETFPGAGLGGAVDFHGKGLLGLRLEGNYIPNGSDVLYNDVRLTVGGVLRLRRH